MVIETIKRKDKMNEPRICPKCKQAYTGYPALSRDDNKTEICPECGMREAIEAMEGANHVN